MSKSYTSVLFNPLFFWFRLLGAYPPDNNFRVPYQICTFFAYLLINIINPLTVIIAAFKAEGAKEIIMLLPTLSGMITCNLKFINTYQNVENLAVLQKRILELESQVDDYQEEVYLTRKIRTVSRIIKFFVANASFNIVIGTITVIISNDRGMFVSAWFPFEWKDSDTTYYLVVMGQALTTLLIVWQDCLNECYPMIFCCAIVEHLHLLNMRFARIGHDPVKTKEENHQDLISFIQYYESIVEIFTKLQDIIGIVYFIEILTIEILLCTNAIYLTSTTNNFVEQLHVICFLIAIVCILGVSCYFGSELQSESQFLITAIYSCNWVEQSAEFKKDLITAMIISQKQIRLFAGRMVQMSLPTFLTVLKSTYSLVALLNNIKT